MVAKTRLLNRSLLWLLAIILIGGFFRFYKLDWGEGFFFHPDEYHIAGAVNRLDFPSQMNPQLFFYGSFTVYLIYFSKVLLHLMSSPFLIGRFYSALFSTLSIGIIYSISKEIFKNKRSAALATFLTAITPGIIQQAHFATTESMLTFWLFLTLYLWIKYLSANNILLLFLSSTTLGLAIGTKISGLTYLPILAILPFVSIKFQGKHRKINLKNFFKVFLISFSLLLTTLVSFLTVFPYSVLDWISFKNSNIYETGLGRGKQIVFYTRQFINTTPVIFQFQKILPWALGPGILLLGTAGFLFVIRESFLHIVKGRGKQSRALSLVTISFIAYFFPNIILFAKWTRFIAPTFAFFSIFSVLLIKSVSKRNKKIARLVLTATVSITLIWTFMFFSIYKNRDVRLTATIWINNNLPSDSFVLTEAGNTFEVPLTSKPHKTSFDFYNLERDRALQLELSTLLFQADYFVIQSRRIYKNHQRLPKMFPATSNFYDQLFSGKLGFTKIKEFSSYPKLKIGNWQLTIPDESAEETWSVFDHPVIRIYEKTQALTKSEYERLLQI
jgi:4-amino-4-deoxy-L-arabinose transferase-like glycosyltransferase